jgi:hypothetical protein
MVGEWMAVFGIGFIILIAALVVIIGIFLIKVWQTKIITGKDISYQQLAKDAVEAQEQISKDQKNITKDVSEILTRISSIEKTLKEVE